MQHFEKLGNCSKVADSNLWNLSDHVIPSKDILDALVTVEELNNVIKKLQSGKALECDDILNEFLK